MAVQAAANSSMPACEEPRVQAALENGEPPSEPSLVDQVEANAIAKAKAEEEAAQAVEKEKAERATAAKAAKAAKEKEAKEAKDKAAKEKAAKEQAAGGGPKEGAHAKVDDTKETLRDAADVRKMRSVALNQVADIEKLRQKETSWSFANVQEERDELEKVVKDLEASI